MKKTLFLLAAAAISTACSMDETTEVAGNGLPIDFRTAVATRSAQIFNDPSDLSQFKAVAFYPDENNFFNEETFTVSDDDGGSYTATTSYYWPTDGSELTFYAYAPTDLNGGTVNATRESTTIEYTPASDISKQSDFITAMNTGSIKNQETGVDLSFKHALSQIDVQAYYVDEDGGDSYTYKINSVKIVNVDGTATYTFATTSEGEGVWTEGETSDAPTTTYEVDNNIDMPASSPETILSDGTWMLIPQSQSAWEGNATNSGTYLAVKIQITDKGGALKYPRGEGITADSGDDAYGWTAVGIAPNWEQGNKYIYQLKFTDTNAGIIPPGEPGEGEPVLGGPIVFNVVSVEGWSDSTEPVELK